MNKNLQVYGVVPNNSHDIIGNVCGPRYLFKTLLHFSPIFFRAPPSDTFYSSRRTVHMHDLYFHSSLQCIEAKHVVVLYNLFLISKHSLRRMVARADRSCANVNLLWMD